MNRVLLRHFLREDAPRGDITTAAVFGRTAAKKTARFLSKQDLVVSGFFAVREILTESFPRLKLAVKTQDGTAAKAGAVIGTLSGPVQDLLIAERLCLNVLQRLSGIATLTARFAAKARPFGVSVLDTRKTTPGLREWEKRAVRDGGGTNHRSDLSEQYLVKDNHIAAAGSAAAALKRVLDHKRRTRARAKVEIEVTSLAQLREVLPLKPDIVLLDNMTPRAVRAAAALRDATGRRAPLLEISGGVTLNNLDRFLSLGAERISVGALTHSAPAADISLEF